MSANDRAQVSDAISVSLEAVPVAPVYPCPNCGAESREHGEAPRHDESQRICSSAPCRKIQPAPEENAGKLNADGVFIRFPCAECGKETKLYQSGRAGVTAQRVCSNATCRNIFET